MHKVSIIVPAYNVAQHIGKCIESILAQTYKNIEVIIVNDGSKDETLEICKQYEKRDSRIHVIDQMNQGVAAARNRGMADAMGEFIGFVDPDDWIEPQMYEKLQSQMVQEEAQICMCNYYKDTKKGSWSHCFDLKQKSNCLTGFEIVEALVCPMIGIDDLLPKYTYIMGCVWRCLYRSDFLKENGIQFPLGITIMEDLAFNVEALLKANRVCIEEGVWYHYVQHKSSILHSYNAKMWEDQMRVHELLEKRIAEQGLEDYMRNRLDMRYIGMTFSAIYNEVNRNRKKAMREKLKNVVEICSDEKFRVTLERAKPIQRRTNLEEEEKEA